MIVSVQARRLLALGIVVGAIAFTVPRFLTHTPYQRLGVRLDWSETDGHPRVLSVVGPPGDRLFHHGDRLLTVDGAPFTRKELFETKGMTARKMLARGPLELTLERDGVTSTITVPPLHLSAWQRVRLYALPVITVIAAPLVAFLLVWRRPDLSTSWVFLMFAVLEALDTIWSQFRFLQGDAGRGLQAYIDLYNAVVLWLPATFLHFMMVFPRPRWAGQPALRSPWLWLVVLAYVTPPAILIANLLTGIAIEPLYVKFQAVAFPLGSLALIAHYSRSSQPDWRPLARERVLAMVVAVTLALGAAVTLLADDPRMVPMWSMPAMQVFYTVLLFAWLTTPLVIAYLIANDPVFDPRRLVARSLPYAVLSGVLAALYLTIVVGAQRLFAAATGEEAIVFNVVAALIVAFAFAPLRERVQRWIDRLYGRDPLALRLSLEQGGRELLRALDRDEVKWAVTSAIRRGLRRSVAIEWPDRGMPRLAEEIGNEDRSAVETLLLQAGIRLENLSLQQERAAAERHAAELREAAAKAELRALHAQVQPHFLFNALNTLSYLIEAEPAAAQRFTERLADMLRYTVQAGDRPASLLSEEIAFVEDFLGIARERYENELGFEYIGPRELLSTPVPPLMLQPLVENSLKHGCVPGDRPLRLALEARSEDGWLWLEFRDDGSPGANGAPGLGVGLENLQQRVRRFGGVDSAMSTSRPPGGGFAVTMRWRMSDPDIGDRNGSTSTGRKGAAHESAVPPRT